MKTEHLCNSCQLEKLGKIYFFHFKYLSTSVFEKIRCDYGDLSLFYQIEKFRYYAYVIDDFLNLYFLNYNCINYYNIKHIF